MTEKIKNIAGSFGLLKGTDTVSAKMFRIFFTFTVVGVIIFTILSVYSDTNRLKNDLITKGRTLTTLLSDNVRLGVFAESREQLNEAISGIMNYRETLAVFVYATDGRELIGKVKSRAGLPEAFARYRFAAPEPRVHMKSLDGMIEFVEPVVLEASPASEESLYFSGAAAGSGKRVIGSVRVLIDTSSLEESALMILSRNIALGCLLLVFGAMMIFYVLERTLRPLKQLTKEVKLLGAGEEIEKISVQSKDEVGSLALAFNEMADNLRKREQEAKELEQRLRHAEKMEAVGTLARGIAHDFNNILTAVEGSMFALRKNIDSNNQLHKYIYHMDNSLSRARVLIQGLLVFSRGQAPGRQMIEVNELIERLMPTITTLCGESVRCSTSLLEGTLVVAADRFQIDQVIMNLVVNARDAMPEGGELWIGTSLALVEDSKTSEVVLPAPGQYVIISVGDTGTGISKDVMERIFEPFYTTKDVGKGAGLGLSIVYGIVEEHKGGISIFSEERRGTEFRIYLPLFEKFEG